MKEPSPWIHRVLWTVIRVKRLKDPRVHPQMMEMMVLSKTLIYVSLHGC
jgi:hypothetical protein